MINIILFGPPGSGKGTQAEKLVKKYNLLHISTGDLFRYNLKNNTKLGIEAKKFIDKGELVPDRVTVKMLKERVEENPKVKGFIFDGFPRTLPQAKSLNRLMSKRGGISKLLMLDVPDEELIKRLLNRGKTSGRADDKDKSIIKNRLQVYQDTTRPVFDYYMKKDCSVKIWGVGDMKIILDRLSLEIESVPGAKRLKPSTKKKTAPKKKATKKTATKPKVSAKKATAKTANKKVSSKKKAAPKKSAKKSTKK